MKKHGRIPLILLSALLLLLPSCSIGSKSYAEPWEIDDRFVYSVVYDAMGGTINTLATRTVYYTEGSLIKEPQGATGMLIKPIMGKKVVLGWYTEYENTGTDEYPVYHFEDEYKWDFDTDRIGDHNTDENKMLTLYACWIDPPTIFFVDADNHNNVLLKWAGIDVAKPMSRPTTTEKATIQRTEGDNSVTYSLLDYYMDSNCTEKAVWGEGTKAIEEIILEREGNSQIYIYCKYIPGEYTRIKNATELRNISASDGKYILANDIDLAGAIWTPLLSSKPFSGSFLGNGYTLSNFNISATNRVGGLMIEHAEKKSFGLFSVLEGAVFSQLNLEDITITVGSGSNVDLYVGAFGGKTVDTVFEDCSVKDITIKSSGEVKVELYLGVPAYTDTTVTITGGLIEQPDLSGLNISGELLIIGGYAPVID